MRTSFRQRLRGEETLIGTIVSLASPAPDLPSMITNRRFFLRSSADGPSSSVRIAPFLSLASLAAR